MKANEKAVISAPKTERRKDLKVSLKKEITVNNGKRQEVAETRNLSAGGIYFESNLFLDEGKSNSIGIEINGCIINLKVEILRVETAYSEDYVFGYGCKFQGLKRKQERILRNFVYQIQREQKKNKNNR